MPPSSGSVRQPEQMNRVQSNNFGLSPQILALERPQATTIACVPSENMRGQECVIVNATREECVIVIMTREECVIVNVTREECVIVNMTREECVIVNMTREECVIVNVDR